MDVDLNLNINATLDVDLDLATSGLRGPTSATAQLSEVLRSRSFDQHRAAADFSENSYARGIGLLEGIGNAELVDVKVQGSVDHQVHVEVNVNALI